MVVTIRVPLRDIWCYTVNPYIMISANSPLEAFLHWEKTRPNHTFLNQPVNRKTHQYSFARAGDEARKVASFLRGLGLPERSHIALISSNCAHWTMADLAIMMAGYVSIPIYPTLDADSIKGILKHSEAKAIIVGKLLDFSKQESGMTGLPMISAELYGNKKGITWQSIVDNENPIEDEAIRLPELDDLHTIIYTSGTTGTPKGVMHSVGNFMYTTEKLLPSTEIEFGSKVFSYLPMAHVAERIIEVMSIREGAEVFFPETLETFAEDLASCQPNMFFGVPRIYAKFQEKILDKIPQKKLDTLLKIPILNSIIKRKLKQKLGLSNAGLVGSGAAPLSIDIMNWYAKLGIEIRQVYGMTEDGCVSHINWPENKVGTVGKAFDEVQTKLTPEGELLIKNKCLMIGYYKNLELTASVFDEDGFFRTGDKGEYDHDGFLTIIGRAKDEFKTDKGKYVSPSFLELEFSSNKDVENICVVGTGIPQPIALVTLSELGLKKNKDDLVLGLVQTIQQVNPKFEKHEKIEKVVVMKESWTVDNGLMTPSLKVKRNAIEKLHQSFYPSWFENEEKVIFES